ncbi:argininosuccinate synthase-related protein [Vibrio bivalvicida]|uniref:argininosuccinate synthase n=1 Tax=Vibrio bivalvicida TaxID=1276888 RepID=A0A177XXK4_9VIBR|nr:argininosuccinate synthase-related protein [Vibrio bivalvicida]OAJ93330.1 argininosuccinate synthase [Vibrio bivalvicida]
MKKLRSIEDIRTISSTVKHVLTLFSGGLDSTYLLEILKEQKVKVTALVVDLGEGIDESNLQLIADHYSVDLLILDAKQEFVEHSLVSAIQAQALYLGDYPVSSSLSRPIIVKKAVQVAQKLKCEAIIHTANQSQNSLRRLNGAIEASGYQGYYGSPYEYSALTREEKTAALFHSGLVGFKSRNVSGDANLWCREFESGVLDDPESFTVSESLFSWSKWNPAKQLDSHQVRIGFRKGYPVTINDLPMNLKELIAFINNHVGAYEIGRYVGFDHLDEDEKVLEVREAPAAHILMKAYKLLETATLPTDVLKAKAMHNEMWTQEAVEGRWGSMLQSSSYAFIAHTAEHVSGSVLFSLSRGNILATSIIADEPKYLRDRDAWEVQTAHKRSLRALTPASLKKQQQTA